MAETPNNLEKVHDNHPDVHQADRRNSAPLPEGIVLAGPVNRARRRPSHIPRHASGSYPAFKAKQDCALKIGCHEFGEEIAKSTGVQWIEVLKEKLTFHRRSQSKLSQQELSELQKATHFDKKELQQWYKGEFGIECREQEGYWS